MSVTTNLRLRQSVGIVVQENIVEFFNSNTRSSVSLKMQFQGIVELLENFDGVTSIQQIAEKYQGISIEQLTSLAQFLREKYILIQQDIAYPMDIVQHHYRLVNTLEDYFHSSHEVLKAIEKLKNATVMIIGLGAVGSLIASYLTKSSVKNFILVDADNVDISNLHRQYYFESDIGQEKGEKLKKQLEMMHSDLNVEIITEHLQQNFFERIKIAKPIDLIINCADEPNVDITSRIISEYAMKYKIPHIVGGGYNLHLTLIGQTIIPFETACFKCFGNALNELNNVELKNVRKLHRENRKLGSFSPLSGIAASLASLDAFKVLIGKNELLQQVNRRMEFNMVQHQLNIIDIPRNPNCEWCKV